MSAADAVGAPRFDVVVPTIGRPELERLMRALDRASGPRPGRLLVVDDRSSTDGPLPIPALDTLSPIVVATGGRGPAAARNAGWRRCAAPWIAFLDDDVVPSTTWWSDLADDVDRANDEAVAVAGRVDVPVVAGRPPTDAERNVVTLASATWITADMAVRRRALVETGGFDERFPRAYREDTELALRLVAGHGRIADGSRSVDHPVRVGSWRSSITAQRGNADDMFMRRLHGQDWRAGGHAPAGLLSSHVATTALAAAGLVAHGARAPRLAAAAGAAVAFRIGRFWLGRVRLGPTTAREWGRMAISSVAIPFAATWWAVYGAVRARSLAPRGAADRWRPRPPRLVLFDRDGTLIVDVPYNGDPSSVAPVTGARQALDRLRAEGISVGLVSNQSGIARGRLTPAQVDAVNARVESLLGPFSTVQVCPHGPDDGCLCRKPATGLVVAALAELGLEGHGCAMVGDIGSDVEAGLGVGARSILVPNSATRRDEVARAPEVAHDLEEAVVALLSTRTVDARDAGAAQREMAS
jgi:HAD superfamily hydrolase (TIGR01662 family)